MAILPRCFLHFDREHDIDASGTLTLLDALRELYWSVGQALEPPLSARWLPR
jgi:hypothetical protein